MVHRMIDGQKKPSQSMVRELMSKHSAEAPDQINLKRARFLSMLKSRYGYTNEKAVDELERLLKQFYRLNRSLGIHHNQPFIKHLPAE